MTTKQSLIVTPRVRAIRTALQVLTSLLLSVPVALAALPSDPESKHVVWAIGISNAAVVLISAVQNAWEASRDQTFKPGDTGQANLAFLVIVALVVIIILMATGAIKISA